MSPKSVTARGWSRSTSGSRSCTARGSAPYRIFTRRCTSGTRVDPPMHVQYTFSLSTSWIFSHSKHRRAPDVNSVFTVTLEVDVTFCVTLLYIWLGVPGGSLKNNIDGILMRSQTPSLAKMKRICAWKFVHSSNIDIGGDIRDQNYLKDTISLIKMTYHTYHSHSKIFKNYDTKPM
jgi:hypothetical protein